MAMRTVYSREELYAELKKVNLAPTGEIAGSQELWCDIDSPHTCVFVPTDQDEVPGYVWSSLLEKVHKLYRPPVDQLQRAYEVMEKSDADIIELYPGKKNKHSA